MVVFRIIGLIFVALALMALGADGFKSLEAGAIKIQSFSDVWGVLSQSSLDGFLAWGANALPPVVMNPVLSSIMSFPAWVVFGVIGILIAFLFRRRE